MDKYRPAPKVVLNSAVSSDTVVMANVGRTVFFTDSRDVDPTICDADVSLYVNDKIKEKLVWIPDTMLSTGGIYKSTYYPKIGDKIRLEARTLLGEVWAEDIIPDRTLINDVKLSFIERENSDIIIGGPNGSGYGIEYKITYSITFKDNPDMKNYYCIRIEDIGCNSVNGLLDYSSDDVFRAQQPIIDSSTSSKLIEGQEGRTFTDEYINGKTYTMKITETDEHTLYHYGKHKYRRIILYSLSESYYKYLTGILNYGSSTISGSLIDFGFSEPFVHYSNINGGVGILGMVQSESYIIDLRTIFPDYWE
ncbi:MAG: DUF4249 domain-containing protein [Muribaculaceae bacterium]